jgi:hypothetical protein
MDKSVHRTNLRLSGFAWRQRAWMGRQVGSLTSAWMLQRGARLADAVALCGLYNL